MLFRSGIINLKVDSNINLGENTGSTEEGNDAVIISKDEYNNLISRIEQLEEKDSLYKNLSDDVNKLMARTTMHTISKEVSDVSIRGDGVVVDVLSIEIPENCYADIFAFSKLIKNHSSEYNSIILKRNNKTLCISGKGGIGYTVEDCLSYSIQLNKGDILSVGIYQSTGNTSTVNANINVNYFPIE